MKKLVGVMTAALMAMSLALVSCSADSDSGSSFIPSSGKSSVVPVFTETGFTSETLVYEVGATGKTLFITLENMENDEVVFQWTNNGDVIDGANKSSFKIPTNEEGEALYYCKVINKKNEKKFAKSSVQPVVIQKALNGTKAAKPVFVSNLDTSVSYSVGASVSSLSVAATANASGDYLSGVISYVWYVDGNPVLGQTSAVFNPSYLVSEPGVHQIYVIAVNTCEEATASKSDSVKSNELTFTVTANTNAAKPNFKIDATSPVYYFTDSTAAALTLVSGYVNDSDLIDTITYQWYSATTEGGEGTIISGANSSTYTPDVSTVKSVYYYCVVTNTANEATGNKVASAKTNYIKVVSETRSSEYKNRSAIPQISSISGYTSAVNVGASVTLTVNYTVTESDDAANLIHYKKGTESVIWYKDNVQVGTGNSYVVSTASAGTSIYKAKVSNKYGTCEASTDEKEIRVIVNSLTYAGTPSASIVGERTYSYFKDTDDVTALECSTFILENAVSLKGTVSYQWYKASSESDEGTAITGATSTSYTPSVTTLGVTYYYVVVTNTCASATDSSKKTATGTSERIKVSVTAMQITNPSFNDDLMEDASYALGDSAAVLEITNVTGNGTLTQQWFKNGVAIAGETGTSFTPDTSAAGVYTYYVEVTNTLNGESKKAASKTVTITVETSTGIGFDFN